MIAIMMLTMHEFDREFESFSHSAFRLECLVEYSIASEAEEFQAFREGRSQPEAQDDEWLHYVESVVKDGKTFTRVRLVNCAPSEYERFELEWKYPQNVAAGENVLIRTTSEGVSMLEDFWMFDDCRVVRMIYDNIGAFVGAELIVDGAVVEQYRTAKNEALVGAVPLNVYMQNAVD